MRYTSVLLGVGLVLAAGVAFGSLALGRGDGAPAEAAVSAPPSGEIAAAGGAGLPDLRIPVVTFGSSGPSCAPSFFVEIHVENAGDATAGSFTVDVNGSQQVVSSLAPLATTTLSFPPSGPATAIADVFNTVVESNETNNDAFVFPPPSMTPAPTCTPDVPTNTPTPSPTGGNPDGDGIPNGIDNCPADFNPGQENNDRNFIAASTPLPSDDLTRANSDYPGDVCDADDDNDSWPDANEAAGSCAGPPTDPLQMDTDGDGVHDFWDCALGGNSLDPASKPSAATCAAQIGATAGMDRDGDRIKDHAEYCGYNTNWSQLDTDLDGVNDGCEAVSLNGDTVVNSTDQLLLAYGIIGDLSGPPNRNADINKDGAVNSADQLMMAFMMIPAGQCPDGGPNLVVEAVWIELETGSGCYTSTTLGTRAQVSNQGNAASGPFVVSINNYDVAFSGLAPAATVLPWAPGYRNPNEEQVWADRYNQVAEKDETDNLVYRFAPIPTLPPTCTATPTATPTP